MIACYYALAYLGFAVPYLVDGLAVLAGKTGAFIALTAIIAALALWTAGYAASLRWAGHDTEADTYLSAGLAEIAILYHDKVKRRFVRTN